MNRDHRTEFGSPMRGKASTDREPRGRRCAANGCTTVLSTYNSTDLLAAHGGDVPPPAQP
jgi:hypothetical protein